MASCRFCCLHILEVRHFVRQEKLLWPYQDKCRSRMNYKMPISLLSTSLVESLPHKCETGKMQGDQCLSLDLLKLNWQLLLPRWKHFLPSMFHPCWTSRSLCPFLRHELIQGSKDNITVSLLAWKEVDMDSTPIMCLHCSFFAMIVVNTESHGTMSIISERNSCKS